MKTSRIALALTLAASFAATSAQARLGATRMNFSGLDKNGRYAAGWVTVLPALAGACGFKLDTRKLNATLVNLTYDSDGTYAWYLYSTIDNIDKKKSENAFANKWTVAFDGNQKEACDTANALWGESGSQFPGVLTHEASLDEAPAFDRSKDCR